MTDKTQLKALVRDGDGKGAARALRREGLVPAIIYGDSKDPVKVSLKDNELFKEYNRGKFFTELVELDVDGSKHLVLPRDVQLHPVKDNIMHVDFLRVTAKTKIPVMVAVVFTNEDTCPGLRDGGILSVLRYEVEVYCSAMNIPESLEIDLSEFQLGDSFKSTDVKLPEGVEFTISDREFTIGNIAVPKEEEEEPEEELAEGEEGEVAEGEEGETAEGGDAEGDAEEKSEE